MLCRGLSGAGHGDRRAWGCSPAALGPCNRVKGNRRVRVRRAPASLPCFLVKLPSQREQHETYTTAVHSNPSPIPVRLASSRHLRNFQGRGSWRWRRGRLLRGAILPSAGRMLALQPQQPARTSSAAALDPAPHSRKPASPRGVCVEPGIYAGERVVPIKESCFRSRIIGGRQSKQMKGLWWKILIEAGQL